MPLRLGLTYTQMKLGRAHEHLSQLKAEVARFLQGKPYTERRYDDIEHSWHIISVEQHVTPDPVGLLVGEFAYGVRSSLDHLAWQLALLTTDKPRRMTAFPIESECPGPKNAIFEEKIASILPQAVKVIESLQPYTRWPAFKSHPLWKVNKLCNIDKHQVIAIAYVNFALRVDGVSDARRRDDEINHTVEIAVPLSEKSQVEFKVDVTDVVFGEPIDKTDGASTFEITIDELSEIYQFVRYDAVPKFERFFR